MPDGYSAIDVAEAERTPSASSGTDTVDLAAELGCTEMRPRVWDLAPGDAMSYHRQREQEELYYVLEGTALRIPPATPRQVFNDTDEDHRWLMIGAPPVEDDGEVLEED